MDCQPSSLKAAPPIRRSAIRSKAVTSAHNWSVSASQKQALIGEEKRLWVAHVLVSFTDHTGISLEGRQVAENVPQEAPFRHSRVQRGLSYKREKDPQRGLVKKFWLTNVFAIADLEHRARCIELTGSQQEDHIGNFLGLHDFSARYRLQNIAFAA